MNQVKTGDSLSSSGGGLGERIRLHARPRGSAQIKVMPELVNAISENCAVDVAYYTIHRDKETERRLNPYYLVPREGHLYLVAYCHLREDTRVFRLSRFKSVVMTDHTFKMPAAFKIDQFLENRWSIIADSEETTFKVMFSEAAARYVTEGDYHVATTIENQPDGMLLLTATVQSRQEFLRWVRTFGPEAEVLEPETVRRELADEYRRMAKVHSSSVSRE